MPKLIQSMFDEVKRSVVWVALLGVFFVVMTATFWSMTTIPQERAPHLDLAEDPDRDTARTLDAFDCDVCIVVHTGDDGYTKPNATNLPFPLVRRLFQTVNVIKKPAQRDQIICMAVDHPYIPCRMARDALGPDVNCWELEQMQSVIPTPVRCDHMVVGNTSVYLPQLTTFEAQASENFTWQQMHVVDFDATPPYSHPPALKHVRPTIVTGFSANHLSIGLLLLRSIGKATSDARKTKPGFAISVVVWCMDEFKGRDKEDLECVVREMEATLAVEVEVRRFKFWAYPEWMRLKQKHQTNSFNMDGTGEYAWKVIMIHTVLMERGLVLWTDAGDRFKTNESLTTTLDYIAEHGFATRGSYGNLGTWTYNQTLLYFRATHLNKNWQNCDASSLGFSLKRYEEIVRPWYECALTRQCIAPDGSSRKNHRQDQAALTVLTFLNGYSCSGIHEDVERQMDAHINDVVGAAKTSCYSDPRK